MGIDFFCRCRSLFTRRRKKRIVLLPMAGTGLTHSTGNFFQGAILEELSGQYEVYSGSQVEEKLNFTFLKKLMLTV